MENYYGLLNIHPIVIVAIIAGVLIGLLGRYWAIRRGDVDTPREAGKVAWRWGLNGAYAFTVGGVVLMWHLLFGVF